MCECVCECKSMSEFDKFHISEHGTLINHQNLTICSITYTFHHQNYSYIMSYILPYNLTTYILCPTFYLVVCHLICYTLHPTLQPTTKKEKTIIVDDIFIHLLDNNYDMSTNHTSIIKKVQSISQKLFLFVIFNIKYILFSDYI